MKSRSLLFLLFGIIICCFSAVETHSQWAIMYQDADSLVLLGTDCIYNLEFARAEKIFKDVQNKYPTHPAGYFLDAMIEWWEINLYPDNESKDKQFFKKIDKVIDKCNYILDSIPYDINALFFKGGAIGYRARLLTMRNQWVTAAQDAKIALDILNTCLQIAPTNHDILLGTGIYNYFSQKFAEDYPIIKPLLVFAPRGDKRLGMFQLRSAAKYARYAKVEAEVVLLQIYYSFENDIYEAVKIAEELHLRYPNNPYFHRYLGRIYVRLGYTADYEKTWREIFSRCSEKWYGYNNSTAREAIYYIGLALMGRGNYPEAEKYFKKSIEGSKIIDKEQTGFLALSYLKLGNIYDAMGKRDKAVQSYNEVLKVKNYNESHTLAKKYLQVPYKI
ncbi:MAG: tetratricopeptide repeat protein [Chloroherpetonaceae bacterium]